MAEFSTIRLCSYRVRNAEGSEMSGRTRSFRCTKLGVGFVFAPYLHIDTRSEEVSLVLVKEIHLTFIGDCHRRLNVSLSRVADIVESPYAFFPI